MSSVVVVAVITVVVDGRNALVVLSSSVRCVLEVGVVLAVAIVVVVVVGLGVLTR